MTTGTPTTQDRLRRRKELSEQLRALMHGREPETGEQFQAWVKRVEEVRAEIKIQEQQ